jgi:hypothetical protein
MAQPRMASSFFDVEYLSKMSLQWVRLCQFPFGAGDCRLYSLLHFFTWRTRCRHRPGQIWHSFSRKDLVGLLGAFSGWLYCVHALDGSAICFLGRVATEGKDSANCAQTPTDRNTGVAAFDAAHWAMTVSPAKPHAMGVSPRGAIPWPFQRLQATIARCSRLTPSASTSQTVDRPHDAMLSQP